ncbi:MAG: glycosyltransferase family 2 protein [Solirubrobacterales bacterium]
MAPPLVSIITPCLNAADTLPEALASVRGQAYEHIEHIVVDGGSTDGTVEILRQAPGISYRSEPDRGLYDAMNKGLDRCSGDIVGWLNADDFYEPGAIDAVVRAASRHPSAEWFTGRCRIVDGAGAEIRRPVTAYKNALLDRYSFRLLVTQNFVSAPATFVRRSAFQKAGSYNDRYRISGDYDMWLRLARLGDPVVIARELAAFRMQEGTLSMSQFELQFSEHAEQARRHGTGHPFATGVNQLVSAAIVGVYRLLRTVRAR